MKILIVNMTRMGDIIQTTPLIRGLREKYPAADLHLLVLKGFLGVARLIPGVDKLLYWDQDETVTRILLKLPLSELYQKQRAYFEELRREEYDLVINLTHSLESAVFTRLLRTREIRGLTITPGGRKVISHPWVNYFFNVTANRGFNDYNLVDVYRRIGDLGAEGASLWLQVPPEAENWAAEKFRELGLTKKPVIALQPGANKAVRQWPTDYFARLVHILRRRWNAEFVVLGTAPERSLGEDIARAAKLPLHNFMGATTIPQLAAVVARCAVVISNDTGTMHLAAALGIPTAAIFLATALPRETAAYTEKAIVLQPALECAPCSHHVVCPHVRCRREIAPEMVARAVEELLEPGSVDPRVFREQERVLVYRSRHLREGIQMLIPLHRPLLTPEQLATTALRLLWKKVLVPQDAQEAAERTFSEDLTEQVELLRRYWQPNPSAELTARVREYDAVLETAGRWGKRGKEITVQLLHQVEHHPEPEILTVLLDELSAVDRKIFALEMQHEFIRPLCVLFRFGRDNLDSSDFRELARGGAEVYRELVERAETSRMILVQLLRKLGYAIGTEESIRSREMQHA